MEENKFEHLMNDQNREELKRKGKTVVTQYSESWHREMPVATVSRYVTLRLPYYAAKKILGDAEYCYDRSITRGNYDPQTKTIEITGLYPITTNNNVKSVSAEIVEDHYTYGM